MGFTPNNQRTTTDKTSSNWANSRKSKKTEGSKRFSIQSASLESNGNEPEFLGGPHEFKASALNSNNSKDYQQVLLEEKEAEKMSIVRRKRLYQAGTFLLVVVKFLLLTSCFPTGLIFDIV